MATCTSHQVLCITKKVVVSKTSPTNKSNGQVNHRIVGLPICTDFPLEFEASWRFRDHRNDRCQLGPLVLASISIHPHSNYLVFPKSTHFTQLVYSVYRLVLGLFLDHAPVGTVAVAGLGVCRDDLALDVEEAVAAAVVKACAFMAPWRSRFNSDKY